jgi:hypothetical protein
MSWNIGETVQESFIGTAGETYVRTSSFINGVAVEWEPNFIDLTGGFWRYTYTPIVEGSYEWTGNGSVSGGITINFDVDPPPQSIPSAPNTLGSGATLDNLIDAVALRSMDLVYTTATHESTDLLTFRDNNSLIDDNQMYAGSEIYFISGANAGLTRRITASDYSTGVLSWSNPVISPMEVGDSAKLYNRRGIGNLRINYKNVINMAIRELKGNAMARSVYISPGAIGSLNPILPVGPENLARICSVVYYDFNSTPRTLRRNKVNGWNYDRNTGNIVFKGQAVPLVANSSAPVEIHGWIAPAELVNPTDQTFVDPEWIAETAAGILQNANLYNAGNLAPGQYMRNRADAIRGKMATSFDANCVNTA